MRKKVMRKIRMKRIARIIVTALILIVGCLVYHFSKEWGEQQAITLCVLGWLYLCIVQFVLLYFIWEV